MSSSTISFGLLSDGGAGLRSSVDGFIQIGHTDTVCNPLELPQTIGYHGWMPRHLEICYLNTVDNPAPFCQPPMERLRWLDKCCEVVSIASG